MIGGWGNISFFIGFVDYVIYLLLEKVDFLRYLICFGDCCFDGLLELNGINGRIGIILVVVE